MGRINKQRPVCPKCGSVAVTIHEKTAECLRDGCRHMGPARNFRHSIGPSVPEDGRPRSYFEHRILPTKGSDDQ